MNTKKINVPVLILALLLFTACAKDEEHMKSANGTYINIPDNYFEEILIERGIDSDGVINQQILKTDAEKINRLDLNLSAHFGYIVDLTGIEGFVNITLLSASGHNIENIDLSYNTKLDSLFLHGNLLSSIDLSNNPNLILVDIQANELSSITGLSNATNLKDLDLSWNYLEEFSIHNESLEVLHISHNNLKSLDTDKLINLQHVFIPFNKLETVDFSASILLETLLISANKLQHIDLDNNTSLTHLYIVDNSLTSLDISNNHELADLRVNRNPELTCIKIQNSQNPYVMKSDYQNLSSICN